MAMAVTKTADNAISFLRFMSLSFRDLSFGWNTMDAHTAHCIRGVIPLLQHGPEQEETESAFLFGLQRGRTPRIMRDRRIRMACRESRGPQNLKQTWQATRVIARTDPDLCRFGLD
jgi:hypothetical protein